MPQGNIQVMLHRLPGLFHGYFIQVRIPHSDGIANRIFLLNRSLNLIFRRHLCLNDLIQDILILQAQRSFIKGLNQKIQSPVFAIHNQFTILGRRCIFPEVFCCFCHFCPKLPGCLFPNLILICRNRQQFPFRAKSQLEKRFCDFLFVFVDQFQCISLFVKACRSSSSAMITDLMLHDPVIFSRYLLLYLRPQFSR